MAHSKIHILKFYHFEIFLLAVEASIDISVGVSRGYTDNILKGKLI